MDVSIAILDSGKIYIVLYCTMMNYEEKRIGEFIRVSFKPDGFIRERFPVNKRMRAG